MFIRKGKCPLQKVKATVIKQQLLFQLLICLCNIRTRHKRCDIHAMRHNLGR